jgi:hypothetical protein
MKNLYSTGYEASPLGYFPEIWDYRAGIELRLRGIGCEIFDPWEQAFGSFIDEAQEGIISRVENCGNFERRPESRQVFGGGDKETVSKPAN